MVPEPPTRAGMARGGHPKQTHCQFRKAAGDGAGESKSSLGPCGRGETIEATLKGSPLSTDKPDPADPLRRRVINWFLGGSALALFASIAYPIARFVSPPRVPEATTDQVDAGTVNDPALVSNGYKIIRFGTEPVIVIKLSDADVRAFSATCTHLACIVEYRKKKHDIYCNCHGGEYNLKGKNIAGPPPKPLTPFKVDLVAKSGASAKSIIVSRA